MKLPQKLILNHGSLFSGIGGFDLAAQWMGWENVFHCEWNTFGQKVLKYYWPNSISYEDITKTDFTIHRGNIDILTGGFPCQPYSVAGKRKGKEDERHLWPEMLRAIREITPRYIVGENVRGLINWNGGMVFDEVQADLETEGYEVIPFLLPACGVSAPHRRDRIWFIAYSPSEQSERMQSEFREFSEQKEGKSGGVNSEVIDNREFTNANDEGLEGGENNGNINQCRTDREQQPARFLRTEWQDFPTQSPVCDGDDGIPSGLDGITFSKWRNESIKAGGNAIVPQIAYQIFKAIEQHDKLSRL